MQIDSKKKKFLVKNNDSEEAVSEIASLNFCYNSNKNKALSVFSAIDSSSLFVIGALNNGAG